MIGMNRSILQSIVFKELRGFLANRGFAIFSLAFIPMFMIFFGLFVYPFLGPPEALAETYQYGTLFVICYTLLVSTFMNLGHSIVLDSIYGANLKLVTMPIDRKSEALGRLIGHFVMGLAMIILGLFSLILAAYIKGIRPLPSPLRMNPLILISIVPLYLASAGIALPLAAVSGGRIQLYNILAVAMINLVPFLSGMFIPLFRLPELLRFVNQFNPFSTAFYVYLANTYGFTVPIGEAGIILFSYLEAIALFIIGAYLYAGWFSAR